MTDFFGGVANVELSEKGIQLDKNGPPFIDYESNEGKTENSLVSEKSIYKLNLVQKSQKPYPFNFIYLAASIGAFTMISLLK